MKILVYGAGNIGSLYAAKLRNAGNDITILARGQRLQEIREQGILLQEFHSGQKTTTHVDAVDRLDPEDAFDLVLVILPRHRVCEVLPILAENRNTLNIMFFGNNASGPDEMVDGVGRERVLLGFPGAAGVRHDDSIRYLILDRREQPTTIGEIDGTESARIKVIADVLLSSGFPTSICTNIDAWLKTHVAEIYPTMGAFYMAGLDISRLKQNREALVLMIRAIREGYGVLSALGVPVTPSIHRIFRWIPEFLLTAIVKRRLDDDAAGIKIGHAAMASDEWNVIAKEFHNLARQSGVVTPSIDELCTWIERGSAHSGD